MSVQNWSESVVLGELSDDPQFTDDIGAILDQCTQNPAADVLLNFAEVNYLNSSNLAKLLKLRKLIVVANGRKLRICGISRAVWGVFLVTGLDRFFEVVDDVPTGLASLQVNR